MDLFKSIFADSDSDEDAEEAEEIAPESKRERDQIADVVTATQRIEEPGPSVAEQEMDDDAYGPRLPVDVNIVKAAPTSFGHSLTANNQEEWVERDKAMKKKKEKKDKKKKSKKKKDKKSKKRKRRHSDVSSSDTDDEIDDAVLLEKIISLKKQQKL